MKPPRVLIVDHQKDYVDTLVACIKLRNIKVCRVLSDKDALEYLLENAVDVVILVMHKPGMEGVDTLKKIRRRHPFIEVIMLTDLADAQTATRVMELGAFEYILKPVKIDELIYNIQDAYLIKDVKESIRHAGRRNESQKFL